jgi:chitodextrinase
MKRIVGLWVLYLGTVLPAFSQVDTSYIYNTNMPYGTLDLRLAKSPTRYYYLREGATFSFRESAPGVKTNTYVGMTTWNTSAYGEGNLREVNGSSDNFVMNYRLLKPQNYNASFSPGYPIVVIIHGGGETANCWIDTKCHWATAGYNPVTNSPPAPTTSTHKLLNNDHQLLHGGSQHLTAVNLAGSKLPGDPTLDDRAFPGFVLFPQSLNGWGPSSTVEDAIRILRLIVKKYNIDESRVYIHGLSNGGAGVYHFLKKAPWLFAAALPMSAVSDASIHNQGLTGEVAKLPLWIFQGGQDNNPTPAKTYRYVRNFRKAGANVRYYLYPHLGHGTWNTAYKEPDFFSWMLENRKYNPHIYYGNPFICNTTQTGVRMAFSKGFFAYQWEREGQIIPDATGPELTTNTPGTYRGRFSRVPNPSEGDWERWSDPIIVSEMNPEKPAIEVIGTAHLRGPGLASTEENNTVKLKSVEAAELYEWYKNGTLLTFPGTDVEDTLRAATFTHASAGSNGAYTLVVSNYNCPSPPSEPVNLFFNDSSPLNISIGSDAIDFRGTVTASSIFLSWNDVSGMETGYEIWRRVAGTPDFKFVTKTPEDAVSYHDTGLNPGTTYEYKLRAVNNSGRSNYVPSDDLSINYTFTTLGDHQSPPPPQDLKVVENTLNTITLSWKPAEDESAVKEYYIYYNDQSISTGKDTTTYTLTGLTRNSVYTITVKALDYGNHFSQPSNQIIATTYLFGLFYKHSTGAWESLDDSAMVATFKSPEFTGMVPNFTLEPRTQHDYFNFQFTGYLNIETEGTYYFQITSNDGSRLFLDGAMIADNDGQHGLKTVSSEAIYLTAGPHPIEVQYFDYRYGHNLFVRYKGPGIGDGTDFVIIPDAALRSGTYIPPVPPAAPTGVAASATGMERVGISWQFTDDALTEYEVYRAESTSGPFEIVARAEGTSAIDSIGLLPGTTYYYKVKTVNNNGSSEFSAVASATTSGDNVAPTVPQEVALVSKTLTKLAIAWKPSHDNVGVTGYEIFSGGKLIGTSTVQAFAVEGLSPNTEYTLSVKAVDASGNRSGASAALVVVTNPSAAFYSLATGSLNELSTWRRNQDGTGDSPANFTDNGQFFVVMNRATTSLDGPWTIGGNASRVVISDGVTLTADHPFSANVELQGNAALNLRNATAPDLVKLSPASTVNFDAVPAIMSQTYGNLILSGTVAKTFQGDTITVLGNLTVHDGLALKGSAGNTSQIRLSGALTLQGTHPPTAADNAIDLVLTGSAPQTIQTGGDLYLYRIVATGSQSVNIANPSSTPVKIFLGSLNGGGLQLANGSVLNINNHDLILDDAAVINPAQQTGGISANGGNMMITSSSPRHSYLYFYADQNRINRLTLDLTGAGNVTVRSPLQISEGIKIKNGTLGSDGNVLLLATAEQTAVIYEIENGGRITGDVTVQQHVPAGGTVYHYLSTPVSGVTVSEWQQSFPITGSFSGSSSGQGLDNSSSLFVYRENNGWVPYPPSGSSNSAAIERGAGYKALFRNQAQPITITAKGNPFQGSISFTLTGANATPAGRGWNLIGNPYASPVAWSDAEVAWTRSGVNNVAAVRSDVVENGKVRSHVTYYDARLGSGIIPAGRAFWVRTFSTSPSLSIHETAKVGGDEQQQPVQPAAEYLLVRLKQGTLSDAAYILFTDEGTDGFDGQYDGRKLRNYGMFNLSTVTADTVLLAVNNVSNAFCSKTVNLSVADVPPGSYSFAFENLQSLPAIGDLTLIDHFTGTSTKVTGADYAFAVTEDANSYGRTRFALTFTKGQVNISGPIVKAGDVCAPGPGYVLISNSQQGVLYQVLDASGANISELSTGTGGDLELQLLPGKLKSGSNAVKITAGFPGCDRITLPGEYTLNLITELTVTTPGDVSICEGADVTLEASGAPVGGFYRWFDSNGVLIDGASMNTLQVNDVVTETVYYVSAAHPNGCESDQVSIHIYADTLDTPVILVNADTLYTDVVGYYQWKRNGEDIAGATLHYYVPVEDGRYSVVASNGGCSKESESYQIGVVDEEPITGIEDGNNSEFMMSIYPIPSDGHTINLLLRSPKTQPVLIEIIDTMGRLHFSATMDAGMLTQGARIVPYAPLYNGVYILRATQSDIKARKKIVVKD